MMYKTLASYHTNMPLQEDQEHPDGPLWPMTVEEFYQMPPSYIVEHIDTGKEYYVYELEPMFTPQKADDFSKYGLRGHKDD